MRTPRLLARAGLALLALLPCLAFAQVGLRPLPGVLWADGAKAEAGPLAGSIEGAASERLLQELQSRWADAYGVGAQRQTSDSMQRELRNLVHAGLRVTRFQIRRTDYGGAKTVFSVYLTGAMFAVNLGTGEVLAARTLTAIAQQERVGSVAELPEAEAFVGKVATDWVTLLAEELAGVASLGEVQATVVGKHRDRLVLAHGSRDGAYPGERFPVPSLGPDAVARVEDVQERLSTARLTRSGNVARGEVLVRPGVKAVSGDAPRLMVSVPDPEAELAPGVTAGELAQWVEDNLIHDGFAVIPNGGALLAAQIAESGIIDVASDALVGAQAVPDVLVLPGVVQAQAFEEHDDATKSDLFVLTATLALSFVDLRSGTVQFASVGRKSRSEVLQEGGRQTDVSAFWQGVMKDAAVQASERAGVEWKPRRASATIKAPPAAGLVGWKVDGLPFGVGTVAEVLARGPEFEFDGESFGFVEDVIGTVSVVESGRGKEAGRVLVSTVPVGPGQRLRAVVGTAQGERRVLAVESVRVEGLDAPKLDDAVLLGAQSDEHWKASLDAERAGALAALRAEVSSGLFEAGGEVPPEAAATHGLRVRAKLEVGPLESAGKTVSRVLRVDLEAELVDRETGEPIELSHKGKLYTAYPMWQKRTLSATERKGEVALGLSDADMPGQARRLLFDATHELLRRLRIMTESNR